MKSKQLFGIANFRRPGPNALAQEATGGKCFVDGVEVLQAHFIDTEQGVVKTFDLRGADVPPFYADGRPHAAIGIDWELPPDVTVEDMVLSRTVCGKVELFGKEK